MVSAADPATYTSNQYSSQWLDPYYLISPTSWGSMITSPAFGKHYSSSFNFWWDFKTPLNDGTWATLFGSSPSYTTGQDDAFSHNYYQRGLIFDPYSGITLGINTNGYLTLSKPYTASFGSGLTASSGDRTSDSCVRDQLGGNNFSTYDVQQADQPWARNLHCDNYMFAIDTSRYTTGASDIDGNCFILLNLKSDLESP